MVRLAKSVSAILLFVFTSTAFVVLPDYAESISWSGPIAIGDGLSGQVASISSAANKLGQIVVAWNAWDENYSQYVLANRYVPGEGWTGAEVIAANAEMIDRATAGIDDSGNCLVVWAQGASVQSRTYTVGVGWEPIVEISSSSASRWFFNSDMVMAPDGAAMAIWAEEGDGLYHTAYRPAGGVWQELSAFASGLAHPVELTNDGLGHFLVVFAMNDGGHSGIWANIFTAASGWGTEVHIESETDSAYFTNVAMNRRGDAVVAWQQFGYPDSNSPTAFANVYSPERGWGTAVPMEELGSGSCDSPVVSIDETGSAVAIWRRVANDLRSSCLRTSTYTAGVGWGTPTTLDYSSDSIDEHISVGIAGNETYAAWIHVVSSGNTSGGYELVANHYNTTSGWETPDVISTDIASSPSVTADNLGGAAIVWYGNATTLDIFVSQYIASTTPPPTKLAASVNFMPDTLNPKRMGKYLTAYIELPEGYDVRDIQLDSVKLDGRFPTTGPYEIIDFDKDKVQELMVKFDWRKALRLDDVATSETVAMTVSGLLKNGTAFQGSDDITIVPAKDKNSALTNVLGGNWNVFNLPTALLAGAGILVCAAAVTQSRRIGGPKNPPREWHAK